MKHNVETIEHSMDPATRNRVIRILHLSDIHLGAFERGGIYRFQTEVDLTKEQANLYRSQLESDLRKELKVERLDYLVISGDIGTRSTWEEYTAARDLVDALCKDFRIHASRLVIVPGNHDLNWDLAEEGYRFVPKRKLPAMLEEGKYIPVGEAGALLLNDEAYKKRFSRFSEYLYRPLYGWDYPLDPVNQGIVHLAGQDSLLFLALNSSWELDHFYRQRPSIHRGALSRALDQLSYGFFDKWLKIAVWHHPVEGMPSEFMERLVVEGFQVCLHGHIHEAIKGSLPYDQDRGIYVIGAGTFGASAREQTPGIPLQYNLLIYDPEQRTITVETRKKEKPEGAWSADARWGDKNNPQPRYTIHLK